MTLEDKSEEKGEDEEDEEAVDMDVSLNDWIVQQFLSNFTLLGVCRTGGFRGRYKYSDNRT